MAGLLIGTAGWSIPAAVSGEFDGAGSHLERYARVLPAVEINSSFYRPHRVATYERWAASVPPAFRFSVKLPKAISHDAKLRDAGELVDRFLGEIAALGDRLGAILVQLPPSLAFDPGMVAAFFPLLRPAGAIDIACEPRHASWGGVQADALLAELRVARVAADPARFDGAGVPGGWPGCTYHRLHGAPQVYRSSYDAAALARLAASLQDTEGTRHWCIFDNTTSGAAARNALDLLGLT